LRNNPDYPNKQEELRSDPYYPNQQEELRNNSENLKEEDPRIITHNYQKLFPVSNLLQPNHIPQMSPI
jgi:hypothetical protein